MAAGQITDVILAIVKLSQGLLLSIVPQLERERSSRDLTRSAMDRHLHVAIVITRCQDTIVHNAQTIDRSTGRDRRMDDRGARRWMLLVGSMVFGDQLTGFRGS